MQYLQRFTDLSSVSPLFTIIQKSRGFSALLCYSSRAINIPIIDNDELYLKAHSSGTVTWDPPGVYIVNCDVDITYYPYDTQSCYVGK